ncbi:hypothetical protein FQR65_LT01129 [Abscondita terminalis]|nr:hypothetical protein FQR65_LT01129 [Abscondita terminalis]
MLSILVLRFEIHTIIMKTVFVLLPLLGFALAMPQNPDAHATIGRNENVNDGLGEYKFGFDTSNGIVRDEQGSLKNVGSENEAMEVHGQSAYTDVTGKKVVMSYVADENGFRPSFSISR